MQCVYVVRDSKNTLFSTSCTVVCALIGQLSSALWLAKYLKRMTEILSSLPCYDGESQCDETKTIKPTINEAFNAFSEDIITDHNDAYSLFMHCAVSRKHNIHVCICDRRNAKQALLYIAQDSCLNSQ